MRSSSLSELIKFFSQDSNDTASSETSSIPLNCGPACDEVDLAGFEGPELNDSSDGVGSTISFWPFPERHIGTWSDQQQQF